MRQPTLPSFYQCRAATSRVMALKMPAIEELPDDL